MSKTPCVYMLRCADGSFYTGWTNDLPRRLRAHNAGTGAKYTRSRRPVTLIWHENCETKEEAMSCEWHIKRLTREEKQKLTEDGHEHDGKESGSAEPAD